MDAPGYIAVRFLPIAWVRVRACGGVHALRYTARVFIADAKKVLA